MADVPTRREHCCGTCGGQPPASLTNPPAGQSTQRDHEHACRDRKKEIGCLLVLMDRSLGDDVLDALLLLFTGLERNPGAGDQGR